MQYDAIEILKELTQIWVIVIVTILWTKWEAITPADTPESAEMKRIENQIRLAKMFAICFAGFLLQLWIGPN